MLSDENAARSDAEVVGIYAPNVEEDQGKETLTNPTEIRGKLERGSTANEKATPN